MDSGLWENHRNEANMYNQKSNEAFISSKEAYKRGDKVKGQNYLNLVEKYRKLRDEYNDSAALMIFEHFNKGKTAKIIDLHQLYVKEAIQKLLERLKQLIGDSEDVLDIIVGRGIHSECGARIKPSVINFANDHCIRHEINKQNEGMIRFWLIGVTILSLMSPVEHKESVKDMKRKSGNPEDCVFQVVKKIRKKKRTCNFNSLDALAAYIENKSADLTATFNERTIHRGKRKKSERRMKQKNQCSGTKTTKTDGNENTMKIVESIERVHQELNNVDFIAANSESLEFTSTPAKHEPQIQKVNKQNKKICNVQFTKFCIFCCFAAAFMMILLGVLDLW